MAGCTECPNYKNDFGPANSTYCRAYQSKLNESQDFLKYYNMGWQATNSCPHGSHSKDYD